MGDVPSCTTASSTESHALGLASTTKWFCHSSGGQSLKRRHPEQSARSKGSRVQAPEGGRAMAPVLPDFPAPAGWQPGTPWPAAAWLGFCLCGLVPSPLCVHLQADTSLHSENRHTATSAQTLSPHHVHRSWGSVCFGVEERTQFNPEQTLFRKRTLLLTSRTGEDFYEGAGATETSTAQFKDPGRTLNVHA